MLTLTQEEINEWEFKNFPLIRGWEKDFEANTIIFHMTNGASIKFLIK